MSFSEWREVKLEELTSEIFSGGTPTTSNIDFWDGQNNWLSSGETRNKFITFTEKTITDLGVKNSSTRLAKKNDVIIASAGQGHTRGQTSLCKIDTYINQSLISIRANSNFLNPHFLFYNLSNRYDELRQLSDGNSIRGSLTTRLIKALKFYLPPIREQQAIAATLYCLDEKIELNKRINKNLEEMIQAIFKSWFNDFEPFQDGEFEDSKLGRIPKGWRVKSLEEYVISIDNRGKTPPLSTQMTPYPIIDVKALSGDSRIINYNNCTKYVEEEIYNNWFRSGHPMQKDILISTVGSLAEMKIFFGDKGCIAQNVVGLRSKNISPLYLYQYLQNIKEDLISYNIGSVQPSIKVTHIIKHKILIPSDKALKEFETIINEISNMILKNHEETQTLTQIRDILLPKLMSGEIRVPIEEV
ncbi:MAG: hypothetical protein JM58_07185 [Peptococcaceae bacterium BICA1-8]|nr:MAG: hypothetical protein JM58_07185 [Peptococcaceae bacterium BICA1-8]